MPTFDTRILAARATHPTFGVLHFEAVMQNHRTYYRLLTDGRSSGSLTDATHAKETIEYWRMKGWLDHD